MSNANLRLANLLAVMLDADIVCPRRCMPRISIDRQLIRHELIISDVLSVGAEGNLTIRHA